MTPSPLLQAARRCAAWAPEARRFALLGWLGAPVVRASLGLVGLRTTLRWVEAIPTRRRASRRVGVADGKRLVDGVFRHHLVGGQCLPRSVLQYLLHRREGLPVRLVVGVQRRGDGSAPGFAAHAWVEGRAERGGAAEAAFAPIFATGVA
jgi:hypothetical protein